MIFKEAVSTRHFLPIINKGNTLGFPVVVPLIFSVFAKFDIFKRREKTLGRRQTNDGRRGDEERMTEQWKGKVKE